MLNGGRKDKAGSIPAALAGLAEQLKAQNLKRQHARLVYLYAHLFADSIAVRQGVRLVSLFAPIFADSIAGKLACHLARRKRD